MFHLQSLILSETFCGKNAEAAENEYIFFFNFCTLARVERGAHKAVAMKPGVYCVRVCNFSIIACIVLVLMLIYKSCKNQGCSLAFLSSVYKQIYATCVSKAWSHS
jgi:hypothetical protein